MTNWHVCQLKNEKNEVVVEEEGYKKTIRKVVKEHETHDLCIIEGFKSDSGLKFGDDLDVGQKVTLIGHPRNNALTLQNGEFIGGTFITIPEPKDSLFLCCL